MRLTDISKKMMGNQLICGSGGWLFHDQPNILSELIEVYIKAVKLVYRRYLI